MGNTNRYRYDVSRFMFYKKHKVWRCVLQETRAILNNMNHMDASIERERDRQKQLMEERKERLRQQKMDKMERAMELLEEALKMDKM